MRRSAGAVGGSRTGAPKYRQIADHIRERIDDGDWAVGDQVPTEARLCEQFGVSRITVVKALDRLVDEGLLVREQGRGTYVAQPLLAHEPSELLSFTESMRRRGKLPGSRVLDKSSRVASARLREQLRLEPGQKVWRLRRLMLADGDPIGVQTSWLPASRFPKLGGRITDDVSLYETLRDSYRTSIDSALETYSAMQMDAEERGLLRAGSDVAAFAVERLSFSRQVPVEFVRSVMRSDATHYTVRLYRAPQGRG